MSDEPHNIAYRLSNLFIDSKLTIMAILAISVFGIRYSVSWRSC